VPKYSSPEGLEKLVQALTHLRSAISLLDKADSPLHIAARVDLAAHQLAALAEPTGGAASAID
jgi:hypothetical protein